MNNTATRNSIQIRQGFGLEPIRHQFSVTRCIIIDVEHSSLWFLIRILFICLNIDERIPINMDTEYLWRVNETTNPEKPIHEVHLGESYS